MFCTYRLTTRAARRIRPRIGIFRKLSIWMGLIVEARASAPDHDSAVKIVNDIPVIMFWPVLRLTTLFIAQ